MKHTEQKIKHDLNLGHNLRALRKRSGMTQDQVTATMQLKGFSMTRSGYSKIECGISNVSMQEILALKELYHAEFEEIFRIIE